MKRYNKHTDTQLIELLNKKDRIALGEVYNRYWKRLYDHAVSVIKDNGIAEDVVHDVFMSLIVRKKALNINCTLFTYLCKAVINRNLKEVRRKPVRKRFFQSYTEWHMEGAKMVDDAIREREIVAIIHGVIRTLAPDTWEVFRLHTDHKLSNREIAERMNLTESGVKNRIYRVDKALKKILSFFEWACIISVIYSHYAQSGNLKSPSSKALAPVETGITTPSC
ncbi:RNA polymerase sigma factor [Chitinophaga rhizophila]|uniref:Sigma-70 family RNA polymerase sigma factor n=1 Tax=Chitinophaga rhizophila TaxID=2866212 RepID=A0ABS7G8H1_9BACT|nr:sigma-70 family RNA polymerase sigma factor [Chitinophaga rhizophila]MBW8683084.1 sigma-70 family RNA polymerase sigma factor [Chitinophaga rhizophila]